MEECVGKRIAEIICRAWNTLDALLFESLLTDDFEYISVWVLETMKGNTVTSTTLQENLSQSVIAIKQL